jgi:hypothetical protein
MNGKYRIGQQVSSVDPEVGTLAGAGADMAVVHDRYPGPGLAECVAEIAVRMGLHGLMGQLDKGKKLQISFLFTSHPDALREKMPVLKRPFLNCFIHPAGT